MIRSGPVGNLPYHTYVEFRPAQGQGFYGGGCIISTMHVLTSASNIEGYFDKMSSDS